MPEKVLLVLPKQNQLKKMAEIFHLKKTNFYVGISKEVSLFKSYFATGKNVAFLKGTKNETFIQLADLKFIGDCL